MLLDNLYEWLKSDEIPMVFINGDWFFAKDDRDLIEYFGIKLIKKRIKNAWLVLTGKARIYQFAEDYFKKDKDE